MEIERPETIIVAPVFNIYEKYCDNLIELIDKNWSGHPEVFFLSDISSKHKISYPEIIRADNAKWPHVVLHGCLELKLKFPEISHIYLLNEEAFPLTKVKNNKINEVFSIAVKNDLHYVYFPAYENNWPFDIQFENHLFCNTPKSYKYYTQLGPAIWKMDHLIATCKYAIAQNILNPWKFETIVTNRDHFISDYNWPIVADGLFKDGYVNVNALKLLSNDFKLKKQLQKDYLLSRPKRLKRYIQRKFTGALNRFLKMIKVPPIVYPYRS